MGFTRPLFGPLGVHELDGDQSGLCVDATSLGGLINQSASDDTEDSNSWSNRSGLGLFTLSFSARLSSFFRRLSLFEDL
jgi:hypothetical protein